MKTRSMATRNEDIVIEKPKFWHSGGFKAAVFLAVVFSLGVI